MFHTHTLPKLDIIVDTSRTCQSVHGGWRHGGRCGACGIGETSPEVSGSAASLWGTSCWLWKSSVEGTGTSCGTGLASCAWCCACPWGSSSRHSHHTCLSCGAGAGSTTASSSWMEGCCCETGSGSEKTVTCKERVLTFTTNYTNQLLLSSQHASELQHTFLNIHMMANQCWSLFLQKRRVYWPQVG